MSKDEKHIVVEGSRKLLDLMKIQLIASEDKKEFIIIYDRPLPAILESVEYDTEDRELYFIFECSQLFVFGEKIQDKLHGFLKDCNISVLIQVNQEDNDKIMDTVMVPLRIR